MKNVMNKVIAAMIMMAIAYAMPATADNHKNVISGRRDHAASFIASCSYSTA